MDESALARIHLFAGHSAEELRALGACLRRRRYSKGQIIFAREDPGNHLYIIEQGRVRISRGSPEGREVVLSLLGPGECFGELALLDDGPRSADAVAQDACELLLLPREEFLRCLERHPSVAVHLLGVIGRRLREADQLVEDALFLDVPARLARTLVALADTQGQPRGEGIAIRSRLTQGELAAMVGTTRESVNKWLGYYERKGLVRNEQGLITVLQLDELRQRIY